MTNEPSCIDYFNSFVQVCTLGVTIYFTSQLVKNDNRREERNQLENLKTIFKNRLAYAAKQAGLLQTTAYALKARYPQNQKEIVLAYEEFYAEQDPRGGFIQPDKFLENLRAGQPKANW